MINSFLLAVLMGVSLEGRDIQLEDMRVSACPFNRVWTGKQRTTDQTKLAKFVSFDLEKPQTLEIRGVPANAKAKLFPLSEANRLVRKDGVLKLHIDRPTQYVIDFGGAAPDLHVFADPPFTYRHVPGELYFGPGEHDAGVIAPTNGQTVCFDRGAVVYGALFLDSVTNVNVVGRGILDNSRFSRADERAQAFRRSRGLSPHDTEFGCHACVIYRSENVRFDGFIIRDTPLWALIARSGSRHIVIDNIKIVGQWRYNSDGIDICASSDVLVKNCFVRTFDDCLVVLGAYLDTLAYVSENIHFENCRCWCDWGATFKIWSPPHTNTVRNVTVSDCAFLHNFSTPIHVKDTCSSADTRIENIVFDRIEMDYDELPLKMVLQESDEARYPGDSREDRVTLGWHLCGWPSVDHGNQKFVRIENPVGQHSLISNVVYRNFAFPGLQPKLVSRFETSVSNQFIRDVRFEGMPPIESEASGEGIELPKNDDWGFCGDRPRKPQ